MKKTVSLLMLSLLSSTAFADISFPAEAKVIKVVENVSTEYVDVEKCVTAQRPVTTTNTGDMTGAVLGTLIGGGLGSTIGKGNGKVAATAVGAAIGAVIGDRNSNPNGVQSSTKYETYEKCSVESRPKNVVNGYNVTYQYAGHTGTVVLNEHPGKTLSVTVNVAP